MQIQTKSSKHDIHDKRLLLMSNQTDKQFDSAGRFLLPDYTQTRPFSSFLPGIAGPLGIPLWVFYVNRGQAIAAFGIQNKDNPIMEFQPANKAYQMTPAVGFRTFIKAAHNGDGATFYEPFASLGQWRKPGAPWPWA